MYVCLQAMNFSTIMLVMCLKQIELHNLWVTMVMWAVVIKIFLDWHIPQYHRVQHPLSVFICVIDILTFSLQLCRNYRRSRKLL